MSKRKRQERRRQLSTINYNLYKHLFVVVVEWLTISPDVIVSSALEVAAGCEGAGDERGKWSALLLRR